MSADQADLGILFVHGIGEQTRGQTLLGFGESLLRWLPRWLGSGETAEGTVELPTAWLEPPAGPPRAEARIRPPGSDRVHTWLLAESWWAQAFVTPRYGQLVRWSVQTLPWTIASHFGTRFRRAVARLRSAGRGEVPIALARVASHLVYLLAGLALIPVTVLLLLLLLVVGLVPNRRVRSLVGRAQQRLAATVGDSYVLLESPIQEASIVGQVKRDLAWLAERCRTVAVVAHSQGAAIAHAAVRASPPTSLRLLLTFGSGLKKLSEIRAIARSRAAWTTWAAPTGFLLVAAALPPTLRQVIRFLPLAAAVFAAALLIQAAASRMPKGFVRTAINIVASVAGMAASAFVAWKAFSQEWIAYVLVGGIYLLVWGIRPSMAPGVVDPQRLRLPRRIRWVDVYSSADPVPNGPLAEDVRPPFAEDVEVHNFGSLLADHTGYWANGEQFVARTAAELAGLDALPLVAPEERDELERGGRRRAWRVPWLSLARATTFILAAVLCVRAADLAIPLRPVLRAVDAAVGLLPFTGETGLAEANLGTGARMGFGIAAVLVGAALWYGLLLSLWRWWSRVEANRVLRRLPLDPWSPPFATFLLVLGAGLEAGVLAAVGWSRAIPAGFATGAWAGGNLAAIALGVVLVRRRRETKSATWLARAVGRAAAIGGLIALLSIPGATMAALTFSGTPGELLERPEAYPITGAAWLATIVFWVSPVRRRLRDRIAGWDRSKPEPAAEGPTVVVRPEEREPAT